jgi:SAM-dependent methyltransferase
MLSPEQQRAHDSFLASYTALRRQEGWERDDSYYLSLPYVPPDDSAALIWRIRRRSLAALDKALDERQGAGSGREWALDLGAGCGWLSRHLSTRGYNTVATDLNIEGPDSLQGVQIFMDHDKNWIGRVQATMDELPFADDSFAVCVASGALHYAPLVKTLEQVCRVLRPGGLFFITDSPVYEDPEAGQAMAAEQRARAEGLLGEPPAPLPGGEGYFVKSELLNAMRTAGFSVRSVYTESTLGRLRSLLRDNVARRSGRSQREHARMPVVIGVKTSSPATT